MASEWYETLRPGITHAEILKLAGTPSKSDGKVDTYTQAKGRIECTYEGDVLQSAVFFDTPDGAVSWTLYTTEGEAKDSDFGLRRAYVKAGSLAILPTFSGRKIFTNKYSGTCYAVDGGFIVVEPIISLLGGVGFFADKAAQVLWLKPDGTETVLYRAIDHWEALKPPELPESQVKKRTMKLKEAGDRVFKMNLTTVLGQSDSEMGSGIDYKLFYLEDGLAVVTCDFPNGTIKSMSIMRPGLPNSSFSEWLNGVPAKATSSHR